jgi:predicted nuclease of predicted toxin-antitoxin system
VRILADVHISPRTVDFLRRLGHDVERVGQVLAATATDEEIVAAAIRDQRIILTQDLDFSAIVALSGLARPSVISVRLASSRIERVNDVLERELPHIEADLQDGALVTIQDDRVRTRKIPIL